MESRFIGREIMDRPACPFCRTVIDPPVETAFDPSQVRALGVTFHTGDGAEEGAENQPSGPPEPAVFYVDSFMLVNAE